jgi:hypothetical protein
MFLPANWSGTSPALALGYQYQNASSNYFPVARVNETGNDNLTTIIDMLKNDEFMLVDNVLKISSPELKDKNIDLIGAINHPKKYPIEAINVALSQLVNDKNEYIKDKYGRLGHLIKLLQLKK